MKKPRRNRSGEGITLAFGIGAGRSGTRSWLVALCADEEHLATCYLRGSLVTLARFELAPWRRKRHDLTTSRKGLGPRGSDCSPCPSVDGGREVSPFSKRVPDLGELHHIASGTHLSTAAGQGRQAASSSGTGQFSTRSRAISAACMNSGASARMLRFSGS